MRQLKNLLFDCFGTLIHFNKKYGEGEQGHFSPSSESVLCHLLRSYGYSFGERQIKEALKKSWQKCEVNYGVNLKEISSYKRFEYFLEELQISKSKNLIKECIGVHIQYMIKATVIDEKLIFTLEQLKKKYNLAVLSNFNWQAGLEDIVNHHRLNLFFDKVISSDLIGVRKPKALFFDKGLELLGWDKKSTVYIGDTIYYDVYGAKNANMSSILVNCKEQCQETEQLESVSQLPQFFS